MNRQRYWEALDPTNLELRARFVSPESAAELVARMGEGALVRRYPEGGDASWRDHDDDAAHVARVARVAIEAEDHLAPAESKGGTR